MKLAAWRIVKAKHAAQAFTGKGAYLAGGRWNSPGTLVVYASQSVSLAMLEMLVHLQSQELLRRYVLFKVSFDEVLVKSVKLGALSPNWKKSPPSQASQQIGDQWAAAQESVILRVPSLVVPTESNFVLNPAHPDFHRITIGPKMPVQFDPRLLKKL